MSRKKTVTMLNPMIEDETISGQLEALLTSAIAMQLSSPKYFIVFEKWYCKVLPKI